MGNKNLFTQVQMSKPDKNVFDLTHDVKLTMEMGKLTPVLCMEAVPGDKFHIGAESLIRFAPMVAPVMHRFDATIHYFFVPNRLLWNKWEQFITDTSDTAPVAPFLMVGGAETDLHRLPNYLGIPYWSSVPEALHQEKVNALPFAAYQCIYDEYYRDQNLQEKVKDEITSYAAGKSYLEDGDNSSKRNILWRIRQRAWEHDYFTSALPFAQKGDPVNIPMYGFNDVPVRDKIGARTLTATPTNVSVQATTGGAGFSDELVALTSQLEVGSAKINDLRRAFRLQEWLEKNARGGTRYIENILAHFGVHSSDKRLQRPEYITGVKTPINISEVLNTTGETGGNVQGEMAGHGVGVISDQGGSYFVEEHGFIMGIMSILPKPVYYQGIPKQFFKLNPLDYYWPSFANIGEQEIQYNEIYAFQDDKDEKFGYVPRYSEYKFMPNRVCGDFSTPKLDFWHAARKFANRPELNSTFIQCDPSEDIFAVTDPTVDKIYVHVLNKIKAVRPMPYFGNPMF